MLQCAAAPLPVEAEKTGTGRCQILIPLDQINLIIMLSDEIISLTKLFGCLGYVFQWAVCIQIDFVQNEGMALSIACLVSDIFDLFFFQNIRIHVCT